MLTCTMCRVCFCMTYIVHLNLKDLTFILIARGSDKDFHIYNTCTLYTIPFVSVAKHYIYLS